MNRAIGVRMKTNFYSSNPYALITAHGLNNFGDHVCKLVASTLIGATLPASQAAFLVGLVSLIYIAPYVGLSPLAGSLADRGNKSKLLKIGYSVQALFIGVVALGAFGENILAVILGLVGIATQSVIIGPARNAAVREIAGERAMGKLMGLQEMVGIGSLLLGAYLGTLGFDRFWNSGFDVWTAAGITMSGAFLLSLLGAWIVARMSIPDSRSCDSGDRPSRSVLKSLWSVERLRWSNLGLSWFYAAGTALTLIILQESRIEMEHSHSAGSSGLLIAILGLGAALGSGLASFLCRKKIEIGLSLAGAIGMVFSLLGAALFWESEWGARLGLMAAGISGGLFSAPLHALLITAARSNEKGRVIAFSNVSINLMCGLFVGLQTLASGVLGISPASQLLGLAVLACVVACLMLRLVPESLVRVVAIGLARLIYPTRVLGKEKIPEEGGVLIACNHVSFADAVLIYAACDRPVRFIGTDKLLKYPWMRWLYRKFNVVAVSPLRAREVIRKTSDALKEGEVVCIFPEGALTRTGSMMPFKGGIELIARIAKVPVVPAYLDGLWGTRFTLADQRSKYKKGMPLRVKTQIAFGEPIQELNGVEELRNEILSLGEMLWSSRETLTTSIGLETLKSMKRSPLQPAIIDHSLKNKTLNRIGFGGLCLAMTHRLSIISSRKRVGVLLPSGLPGSVVNVGLRLVGKSSVNLNPTVSRESLLSMIDESDMDTIVTSRLALKKYPEFEKLPVARIFVEDLIEDCGKFRVVAGMLALLILPFSFVRRIWKLDSLGSQETTLLFSSGSSSKPKGIPLSDRNLIANCCQLSECRLLEDDDRILGNMPLFHSFGYSMGMWMPLLRGLTLVTTLSPLDMKANLAAIRAHRPTVLIGAPTFLRPYLRKAKPENMVSLRFTMTGAERAPGDLLDEWRDRFGSPIFEGYGMTECSPVVAVNCLSCEAPGEQLQIGSRDMSVGRLLPGMSARVALAEDRSQDARPGEAGVLFLRGPNVFGGYRSPALNADRFVDGDWLDTGDIARIDSDGFLVIEGRVSRFSKIGGEMVPHQGVEEAIAKAFPAWASNESPVFAVGSRTSEKKGEALVLLTRFEVDSQELKERLRKVGIPNLWMPNNIRVVPDIPTLATGKLDLRACSELCAA